MTILDANQKLLRKSAARTGRMIKEDGTVVNEADAISPWVLWSTNDDAGPTLLHNTIGFNNSVGATSTWILHAYNAATGTWTATTQTFDGFIGL